MPGNSRLDPPKASLIACCLQLHSDTIIPSLSLVLAFAAQAPRVSQTAKVIQSTKYRYLAICRTLPMVGRTASHRMEPSVSKRHRNGQVRGSRVYLSAY